LLHPKFRIQFSVNALNKKNETAIQIAIRKSNIDVAHELFIAAQGVT
jgi:hypothetical protein